MSVSKFRQFIGLLNGFRKFAVMSMVLITGIIFRVTEYIDGSEFVDLVKNSVVAYMAFNGLEHTTKAVVAWVKKKVASNEDS